MQYVYAVLWFVVGLILIFSAARENKIFYAGGGFFLLLGAWWLADALTEEDLFAGAWGMVLKGVGLAALALFTVVFLRERKKSIQQAAEQGEEEDDGSDPDGDF